MTNDVHFFFVKLVYLFILQSINMKLFLCWIVCLFSFYLAHAQKVGLVLSGGGGRGLAHVGVLKCLEEQGIKIDYIVGTSMGGLVGGFYAAGYSASEIEKIVTSEEFQRWASGKFAPNEQFALARTDDDASMISFDLEVDTLFHAVLNPILVNDIPLNFALARLLYVPVIRADMKFDHLPIPFRCIAADVYTQKAIVLKEGLLNDALRATMTVPLFFRPIKVDNRYLFDGGIYDNFGVEVMRKEFDPDIIIGVNVAKDAYKEYPYNNDEELLKNPIKYALIANSDTTLLTSKDILIEPKMPYSATQFDRVKEKIKIGYDSTQAHIEEIKRKIAPQSEHSFLSNFRQFTDLQETNISKFTVTGVTEKEAHYIRGMFKIKKNHHLSIAQIRKQYFRLSSYPYFQNIYPRFFPDEKGCYEFQLEVKDKSIFKISGGGNLSTRGVSMIYGGVNFNYLRKRLYSTTANIYAGTFYRSFQAKLQINYAFKIPFYVEPQITLNNWDYIQSSELFIPIQTFKTNVRRFDRFIGGNIGVGLSNTIKAVLSVGAIANNDEYSNNNIIRSSDTLDITGLGGGLFRLHLSSNTLNRKQFANAGGAETLSLSYFNGIEIHEAGNTSIYYSPNADVGYFASHQWVRLKASTERYIGKGKYRWGYLLEGVISNQPTFRNFRATLINASAFYPLLDSRTLFLSDFRAFSYLAGGFRNIISLSKKMDFRLEGYVFKPFNKILEGERQNPILQEINVKSIHFAGSAIVIYHSPLGPASINLNYYDDVHYKWGFFLNVGLLIFNKRAMEE
jgi:NTE family protein